MIWAYLNLSYSYSGMVIITIHLPGQVLYAAAAATAKSLQSCPTLCDPIDSSPPGSPVPGILQASSISKTHMYGFTFSFIGILFLHKSLKLILDFNLSETFYSTS